MGITADEFTELRLKYEDDRAIDKMNEFFEKNGLILKRSFGEYDHGLKWIYTFKDVDSFNKWEKNLYDLGMVQKDNRPYEIDREYIFLG